MKDILPFIIAIAFFAYKQYKKNESKKSQIVKDEVIEEKTELAPSLDDFIGSFFGEQAVKEEYQVEIDSESNEIEIESFNKVETELSKEPYSIEYDNDMGKVKKAATQFEMIQNKDGGGIQLPDFDLRNAIIYDAILNPPYISK